jgi:hypothetical protein
VNVTRALVFFVALLVPCSSDARCIPGLPDFRVRKADSAVLVFRGTVQAVTRVPGGEIVIVAVDQVWNGTTPKRMTVYNHIGGVDVNGGELVSYDAKRLMTGERYIIIASAQNPADRRLFGITGAERTYGTNGCGIWLADGQDVSVLGEGRDPE